MTYFCVLWYCSLLSRSAVSCSQLWCQLDKHAPWVCMEWPTTVTLVVLLHYKTMVFELTSLQAFLMCKTWDGSAHTKNLVIPRSRLWWGVLEGPWGRGLDSGQRHGLEAKVWTGGKAWPRGQGIVGRPRHGLKAKAWTGG